MAETAELPEAAAVARIAASALRGNVDDSALAARCAVAWLGLPDHVRYSCPQGVRAALDGQAWTVAGWATRHRIAAAGTARAGWLDALWSELDAIDDRTFHALVTLAQQALMDVLVKAGMKVRDTVKASGGVMPTIDLAETPAWARRNQGITAALDAKQRDLVADAGREITRRSRRVLAGAAESVAVALAAGVSPFASSTFTQDIDARVDAAASEFGASFVEQATVRVNEGADGEDDLTPIAAWFPGALAWAAMSLAGAAIGARVATSNMSAGIGLGALAIAAIPAGLADIATITEGMSRAEAGRLGLNAQVVDTARAVALGRVRYRVERRWQHVTAHNAFDPHKQLDGSPADTAALFVHTRSFPRGGIYHPGDHAGCRCRWRNTLVLDITGDA